MHRTSKRGFAMSYELGPCRPEELPELADFCNRIFRSARPGDMFLEYPLLFHPGNVENLLVARYQGRVVAHVGICLRDAAILGAGLCVASIGSVGTDPEHRGRQLASQLMELARRRAKEAGASLMLISGTRGLYHRLGYVEVGDFRRYTAPAGEGGEGISLQPASLEEAAVAACLFQQEPVRFFRSLADWQQLLEAGRLMNYAADLLIVHRHGAVAAYAAVQRPRRDTNAVPGAPLLVGEFAGSRRALAAALPAIAARYGAPGWELVASACDTAWTAEAAARGWLGSPVAFPGTLGIIDAERFLNALAVLIRERCGDALEITPHQDGARLQVGGETCVLTSRAQLTALVFGGHSEEARALSELPARIAAAVRAAFPLPLLWYGYNYV